MRWTTTAALLFAATFPTTAHAAKFTTGDLDLVLGGHAEAFYSYVFANPANGVNNARIFDTRHNTFALSSAGLSLDADTEYAMLRLALWFGTTSEAIYSSEPPATTPGTAGAGGKQLWRFIQEAYARGKIPVGYGDIHIDGGIFVSPIGLENVLAKDNWNYSSSNLNFMLPFYHTGLRVTVPVARTWTVTAGIYNGWSNVIDNNADKSFALSSAGTLGRLDWGATYWLGNERAAGSPEGSPWLQHFDAWGKARLFDWFWAGVQADFGFESNRIDSSVWYGGALYGRFRIGPPLHLTLRVDYFSDRPGDGVSPLFFAATWVSSQTATLELSPNEFFAIRLEYRHDEAGGPLYFDADPTAVTADHQNVFTIALLAQM